MGNRKDRRRAALSTAGRRVKLDLFAEPSGELGGSSVHENGGGDTDSKHSTGSPEPLSSGQPTKNPLLLLGQYSDDEEDDKSNGSPSLAAVINSPKDHTEQVIESTNNISDGAATTIANLCKTDEVGDPVSQDDTQAGSGNQKTAIDAPNHIHQNSSSGHHNVPESSDMQVVGDVSSGWKMVMHEATNQCYYWNVETGETSWEVPKIISQTDEATTAHKLFSSSEGVNLSNPSETPESGLVMHALLNSDHANTVNEWGQTDQSDKRQLVPESGSSEPFNAYASSFGTPLGAYYSYQQSDGNAGDWNNLTTSDGIVGTGVDENVRADDLSSRVVQFGEYLLERLQSLKGSLSNSNGQEWISRYILEVEFRLSDIRSLLSYGPALLPFWVHSERKLRQLGEAFNYEASQLENPNNVELNCVSTIPNGSEVRRQIEKVGNIADLPPDDICNASGGTKSLEEINTQSADGCINAVKIPEDECIVEHAVVDTNGPNEKLFVTSNSNQSPRDHAEDDMDMDVDMDVEEPTLPSCIAVVEPASQSTSVQHLPLASENELRIPTPPDEGWIPPPPPDDEMIPPPPPPDNEVFPPPPPHDDPLEFAVQPPAYTNPYNPYPEYTYGYYDQAVAGVQGAEFHGQVEGYQVAMPQAGVYYEVSNSYVTSTPAIVNSLEPVLYYDPQGRQVQPPTTMNGASTGLHITPGLANHNILGESGISCSENEVSTGVQNNEKGHTDASSVIPAAQSLATVSAQGTVSLPAIDSATIAKATISKGQSKASRVKKRTSSLVPSMRSNKKVSSLVDKWKAAKEELQEDEEDEPEDSYEALEKKRQREIEEWRAKQIASGEAKDNANFQPLGGDWRERVKRRRAQLSADAPQTSSDEANNGKQEPGLIKLAKNLPPGWQVYRDDSSKQVYYGNTNTSETTWIRPTK